MKIALKWILIAIPTLILGTMLIVNVVTEPSNDRNWTLDQKIMPYAEINGEMISIHNVRNFKYTSASEYESGYYDKTYDLSKLERVYYVVEPFSGFVGSAHTFLSFEFEGDEFVSISVEIRKEIGESFSAVKGLFNQYELMYVIADEKDVVKLRSNYRKDLVYVYPVKTTKEKIREVFLDMVTRANKLYEQPEFYNTLINTCTTNLVKHANKITPKRVPFSYKVLLPAYSDQLAYDIGLIDTELSFEEARKKFLINERAEKFVDDPNFSRQIRD